MARASSKTVSFDIQSMTTGEQRVIIERSYVKSTKVGGKFVTASKRFALFDQKGRQYERVSDNVVTCRTSGERFHVIGKAEAIRKIV